MSASAIETPTGVIPLAQALIGVETTNPPGHESRLARPLAKRLRGAGLEVELGELAPGRAWLVARLPGGDGEEALCLSGHLDTVGIGSVPWSRDPFGGEIEGDLLYGRGASDMKGAIAAMVIAMESAAAAGGEGPPVMLALSAGEETGCEGAPALAAALGPLGALLVGESTGNRLAIGHKGVTWLTVVAQGRAAHAATPELGDNAVSQMARFLLVLDELDLATYAEPLLGSPTLSLGTVHGGTMVNVVPDRCEAEIDIRLTPSLSPERALALVGGVAGGKMNLTQTLTLGAVVSELDDPWIYRLRSLAESVDPGAVPYFTDAAVLAPACGAPPVAILGPGEASQAHRVDECCSVAAIEAATDLYAELIADWRSLDRRRSRTQGDDDVRPNS